MMKLYEHPHCDRRRSLLDATLMLVQDRGAHGFSLRAVARVAGVTPTAVYNYFADKEALLAGLAEDGFELFRDALSAASCRPSRSARERSRNVAVAYVLFALEHPTLFRVMAGLDDRHRRGNLGSLVLDTYRVVRSVLIEELKAERPRPISDVDVLGWWSVVHGLAFLAIDGYLECEGGDMSAGRMGGNPEQDIVAALEFANVPAFPGPGHEPAQTSH